VRATPARAAWYGFQPATGRSLNTISPEVGVIAPAIRL